VRSTVVASLPRIITPFGGWESAAPPRPRRAGAPVERSSESTAHHGVGAAIVREDRPVAYGSNGTDRMPALRRKSALQHAYRARPSAPTSVPPPQRAGSHGVLGAARAFAARECRLAVDTLGLAFRRMLTMSLAARSSGEGPDAPRGLPAFCSGFGMPCARKRHMHASLDPRAVGAIPTPPATAPPLGQHGRKSAGLACRSCLPAMPGEDILAGPPKAGHHI
jgi:hypothetical protein